MVDFVDVERKKALDFLSGDPHVMFMSTRPIVRRDKEKEGVIVSQERKNEKVEIKNPRLRTEAYLRKIGKL